MESATIEGTGQQPPAECIQGLGQMSKGCISIICCINQLCNVLDVHFRYTNMSSLHTYIYICKDTYAYIMQIIHPEHVRWHMLAPRLLDCMLPFLLLQIRMDKTSSSQGWATCAAANNETNNERTYGWHKSWHASWSNLVMRRIIVVTLALSYFQMLSRELISLLSKYSHILMICFSMETGTQEHRNERTREHTN